MDAIVNNKRVINLFLIFILIQPVIDILTTLSIVQFESSATVGVLIRFLYMFAGIVFILLHTPRNKFAKYSFIYLLVLGLFTILTLVINYVIKSPFYIGQEFKFFIKVV
jgi:hypothetical protein